LDADVKESEWCQANAIATGAGYLKCWIASLFQHPTQPLPYLFFYGPQSSGKSSFHEAIETLMSRGCVRANNAITSSGDFNGELESAVLCVVEEVDLSEKRSRAYNKIKDFVTGRKICIHPKRLTPVDRINTTHWVQCSNDKNYCPVFEGDTRITVIYVAALEERIKREEMFRLLKKEAPDFLAEVLALEFDPSNDRMGVAVLETGDKEAMMDSNRSPLAQFITEECVPSPGSTILQTKFKERFHAWLRDQALGDSEYFKSNYIKKNLPPEYLQKRLKAGSKTHVCDLTFAEVAANV